MWSLVPLPFAADNATVIFRYGLVVLCVRWQMVTLVPLIAVGDAIAGSARASGVAISTAAAATAEAVILRMRFPPS